MTISIGYQTTQLNESYQKLIKKYTCILGFNIDFLYFYSNSWLNTSIYAYKLVYFINDDDDDYREITSDVIHKSVVYLKKTNKQNGCTFLNILKVPFNVFIRIRCFTD